MNAQSVIAQLAVELARVAAERDQAVEQARQLALRVKELEAAAVPVEA